MRTNIEIDDELMASAMECTGLKTKKAVVEEALRALIRRRAADNLIALRGKVHWEGDLDEMRSSRLPVAGEECDAPGPC